MKIKYSTRNAMQSEHAMTTWNCKEPDQRQRASFGTLQVADEAHGTGGGLGRGGPVC
ncbi:hypothetical protein [Actinacidiphila oryziradicis]|uniref:hypothetical protein n=1 Tax=Actinacidiphila oryziradicis TaxID=2571141 RepID=UPI00145EF8C0|nr:hypothetical protein [Actinacidiphila oryziradicis]